MACSKLWYIAPVLHLPEHYLKRFYKALFQFIWNKVQEPVKRTTLIGKTQDGGLAVVSEAFRIKLKLSGLCIKLNFLMLLK